MYYQREWVKVRESLCEFVLQLRDCYFYKFGRNGYNKTKQNKKKAKHMFQSVTWLILGKWLSFIIRVESEGSPWAVTGINPNAQLAWKRPRKTDGWKQELSQRQCERSVRAQTIIDGDRLLEKRKRQSKMKTKADTPVPWCIASQQLQSWSWWFRKAHSHLALVALLGKG